MAAKFVARLQADTRTDKPVLLRVDYDAGHGIGSTQSQQAAQQADEWSFLLWQFGDPEFQPAERRRAIEAAMETHSRRLLDTLGALVFVAMGIGTRSIALAAMTLLAAATGTGCVDLFIGGGGQGISNVVTACDGCLLWTYAFGNRPRYSAASSGSCDGGVADEPYTRRTVLHWFTWRGPTSP